MRRQKSPATKEKIEIIFARLNRLGLGGTEVNEDVVDLQESMRRADLFMSVISIASCPIPL